ncbi:hypothetical protein VI817_004655 [Penicillium citrinum]|nr:hypothetical protein VI817_004655 [Penicillium citrinum]
MKVPTGIFSARMPLKKGTRSRFSFDVRTSYLLNIEGLLEDEETLDNVSRCGADAFVSFAGPPSGNTGTLVSQGVRRVLILCTPCFKGSYDVASFKWRIGGWTMKFFPSTRGQFEEMISMGGYITSIPVEEAQWTLFRVGGLTNGGMRPIETTFLGSGREGMWISRASVARWVMDEATQDKWVGEMPKARFARLLSLDSTYSLLERCLCEGDTKSLEMAVYNANHDTKSVMRPVHRA